MLRGVLKIFYVLGVKITCDMTYLGARVILSILRMNENISIILFATLQSFYGTKSSEE